MSKVKFSTCFLAVFVLIARSFSAQVMQGSKQGTLEASLEILNLFQNKPEAVQRLYSKAYSILAADRQATFVQVAENPDIQRLCKELGMRHWGGPLLGSVTEQGMRVWLRTLRPARVEVRVTVDGVQRSFGPVMSTPESDLTAVVPVTGLTPDRHYPYRVMVDGKAIALPKQAVLVTAPEPAPSGKVRITFGSCFHRWGLGNEMQSNQILHRQPAAMLLIGDIAVQDRNNHLGLHRADYLMRDLHPAWQALAASVPIFATWDDHDYFDNDKAYWTILSLNAARLSALCKKSRFKITYGNIIMPGRGLGPEVDTNIFYRKLGEGDSEAAARRICQQILPILRRLHRSTVEAA